ncbi:MAG TPA: serine/threonine-protein kinase [Vicinamibacterales bacterium]|jgi:non-specific serine/threonine protein kinase/serine/threonine-protein kinase
MQNVTPELWLRVKDVAATALELSGADRGAFVEQACAGDEALRAEVVSLLASTDAAAPYFETVAIGGVASLYDAGSRIGAYRIVRELGSGGMGTVYLAERDDGEFTQRAAIKIVRGGFANSFLLERFREERRILASLDHPNIAHLLDGGTTERGLPYVVMEFVEGQPIDEYCVTRQLPLRERLALFQHVCDAVQYAHHHLVVHRDIKAANVLVSSGGVPKLLDFGIAKLLDADPALPHYTVIRVMTPESASPEQLSGRPVTVAADVYALGVLLYRLMAGVGPYGDSTKSDVQLIRSVCEVMPDRPSARSSQTPRIPSDVDMIVLKALRKEPERRYASPLHFAEDIQRFLDGRPVLASPDSVSYRVRKFVGRHRVAVVAACAAAIAIGTGVTAAIWEARVAERQRVKAEQEFNAVRGFAQAMLGEMHDAVVKLPGSTAADEILLRHATTYLDALWPQAQSDEGLRREVARGYGMLAGVQGTYGLANIGDQAGARASLLKVITLLDPLVAGPRATLADRLYLAKSFAVLVQTDTTPAMATAHLARARAIVEALTPAERVEPEAIQIRESVWSVIANAQIEAHDYAAALESQQRGLEAATEHLRASPDNLAASRNLSLSYKQVGALLEVLDRAPEAVALYEKAVTLDEDRVRKDPATPLWRLDLSFAKGSIGSLVGNAGDLVRSQSLYEEAVALREDVVKQDPANDFALTSLARGYDRLARLHGQRAQIAEAFDYAHRRLDIFRRRLQAHPERERVWRDYTAALASSAEACQNALAVPAIGRDLRRTFVPQATAMLDAIDATQQRWIREHHAGPLPPAADAVQQQRADLLHLLDGR